MEIKCKYIISYEQVNLDSLEIYDDEPFRLLSYLPKVENLVDFYNPRFSEYPHCIQIANTNTIRWVLFFNSLKCRFMYSMQFFMRVLILIVATGCQRRVYWSDCYLYKSLFFTHLSIFQLLIYTVVSIYFANVTTSMLFKHYLSMEIRTMRKSKKK